MEDRVGGMTNRSHIWGEVHNATGENKQSRMLHIGDIVALYTDDAGGFLEADGFSDGHCWARREDRSCSDKTRSFSDCLFRVMVKQVYAANKKLAQKLNKTPMSENSWSKIEHEEALEHLPAEEKQAIRRLVQEAKAEAQQNEYETARSMGSTVAYGQVVQLQHVKSGKFVTVRPKEVAEMETGCQKVIVSEQGSQDSWFIIQPRYKVQSAGEAVLYGDSVSIEAAKLQGQTLHCSQDASRDAALQGLGLGIHEVNSHTEKTTWKIKLFGAWSSDSDNHVCAGDVVRLRHSETGAFLSCGDQAHTEENPRLWCKPHVRAPQDRRGSSSRQSASSSSSAFTSVPDVVQVSPFDLWRVEHEDKTDGGSIAYARAFHLQHLVTGKYLSIGALPAAPVPGSVAYLDARPMRESLLCCEHTAGQIGAMDWQHCSYIRCESRGLHLHVASDGSAEGATERHTKDAFSVIRVPPSYVTDLYEIQSVAETLRLYLALLQRKDTVIRVRTKYTHRYILRVLQQLVAFCQPVASSADDQRGSQSSTATSSSVGQDEDVGLSPRKQRQDMLRDLRVLEVLMLITKETLARSRDSASNMVPGRQDAGGALDGAYTARTLASMGGGGAGQNAGSRWDDGIQVATAGPESEDAHVCTQVFCVAHEALRVAITGRPESGYQLRQYVELLQKQISSGQSAMRHATRTLSEMFRDNVRLNDWLPVQRIDFFLSNMDTNVYQRALYVEFLSMIVCCNGRGMRRHQDSIVKRFLLDKSRSAMLVATASPEKGIVQVCIRDAGKEDRRRFIDVESFCASALTHDSKDRHLFDFYLASLHLMADLCTGINYEARALICGSNRYVTYEALLQGITNDRIPAKLRCAYTRVLHHAVVVRPPVDYVTPYHTTLILDEIAHASSNLPLPVFKPGADLDNFKTLKSELLLCLSNNTAASVPENEPGINAFVLSVTCLFAELLKLGFFSSESEILRHLVPPLLSILDGSSDNVTSGSARVAASGKPLRYVWTPETAPIMQSKLEICRMIDLIFDLRLSARVPRALAIAKEMGWTDDTTPTLHTTFKGSGGGSGAVVKRMHSDVQSSNSLARTKSISEALRSIRSGVHAYLNPDGPARMSSSTKFGPGSNLENEEIIKATAEGVRCLRRDHDSSLHELLTFLEFPGSSAQGSRLSKVLLDLMHYEFVDLATLAMRLLMRERLPKLELFRCLHGTQLLTSAHDAKQYTACIGHVTTMRRCVLLFFHFFGFFFRCPCETHLRCVVTAFSQIHMLQQS
jgi:hypothetical protein